MFLNSKQYWFFFNVQIIYSCIFSPDCPYCPRPPKFLKWKKIVLHIFNSSIRFQKALNHYYSIIFCRDMAKSVFWQVWGPNPPNSVIGHQPPKFLKLKKNRFTHIQLINTLPTSPQPLLKHYFLSRYDPNSAEWPSQANLARGI